MYDHEDVLFRYMVGNGVLRYWLAVGLSFPFIFPSSLILTLTRMHHCIGKLCYSFIFKACA
jgi:hypothetical protein